eukprot:7049632-Alexandrium_andersonii.AAC.1
MRLPRCLRTPLSVFLLQASHFSLAPQALLRACCLAAHSARAAPTLARPNPALRKITFEDAPPAGSAGNDAL